MRRVMAGIVVLTLASSGCSLVLAHGPPGNHTAMRDFGCTQSNFVPVLDLSMALVGVAGFVFATRGETHGELGEGFQQGAQLVFGSVATVWGTSSIVGFGKTRRCREAKRLLDKWSRTDGASPTGP